MAFKDLTIWNFLDSKFECDFKTIINSPLSPTDPDTESVLDSTRIDWNKNDNFSDTQNKYCFRKTVETFWIRKCNSNLVFIVSKLNNCHLYELCVSIVCC